MKNVILRNSRTGKVSVTEENGRFRIIERYPDGYTASFILPSWINEIISGVVTITVKVEIESEWESFYYPSYATIHITDSSIEVRTHKEAE